MKYYILLITLYISCFSLEAQDFENLYTVMISTTNKEGNQINPSYSILSSKSQPKMLTQAHNKNGKIYSYFLFYGVQKTEYFISVEHPEYMPQKIKLHKNSHNGKPMGINFLNPTLAPK